eukprot:scaffold7392_cov286-Pinguiococcus_pyrenoidosus.AAC.11
MSCRSSTTTWTRIMTAFSTWSSFAAGGAPSPSERSAIATPARRVGLAEGKRSPRGHVSKQDDQVIYRCVRRCVSKWCRGHKCSSSTQR